MSVKVKGALGASAVFAALLAFTALTSIATAVPAEAGCVMAKGQTLPPGYSLGCGFGIPNGSGGSRAFDVPKEDSKCDRGGKKKHEKRKKH